MSMTLLYQKRKKNLKIFIKKKRITNLLNSRIQNLKLNMRRRKTQNLLKTLNQMSLKLKTLNFPLISQVIGIPIG